MDADSVQSDLEDFMSLITKWSTLINPPACLRHNSLPKSEATEQYDYHSWIMDDYKSDLAHMQRLANNVALNEDVGGICKSLGKVALALQLSHVSYSTVAEVLTDLQDTERVARRVCRYLDRNVNQTRLFLTDVQNYINATKTSEQTRGTDLIEFSGDCSDFQNVEAEILAKKKIAKYSSATEAHRLELGAKGVFLLCPPETAASATSPNGTGPLPHAALLAYSSLIKAEDEKQAKLLRRLEGAYGVESFLSAPADLAEVESEIESLRRDCEVLEEQLREATC